MKGDLNMKNVKHVLILTTLITQISLPAFAEVRETNHMTEALAPVQVNDIVVFDLDNTVLEAMQTIGSDQWFEHQVKNYKAQGFDDASAVQKSAHDFTLVHQVARIQPVEAITPSLIRNLQKKGITVIGLTARPNEQQDLSVREVRSIGVDFRATHVADIGNALADFPGSAYKEGILFANGQNKGALLISVLREAGLTHKRVIFVDDKVKNVTNMDDALTPAGLESISFRYGAADAKVKAFDPKIADRQFAAFQKLGVILSDAEEE